MYIRRIQILNIRGFREVDLDLSRPDGSLVGWTVLAGRNGSGKSTLLQAIALAAVGPDAARALRPTFAAWLTAGVGEGKVDLQVESTETGDEQPEFWERLEWKRDTDSGEPAFLGRVPLQPKGTMHWDVVHYPRGAERLSEVKTITERLTQRGIRVWKPSALKPGTNIAQAYKEALASIPVVLVFFAPALVATSPDEEPIKTLGRLGRLIIPVVLSSHLKFNVEAHRLFARYAWVDFRTADPDSLEQLVWGITGHQLGEATAHEELVPEYANGQRMQWFLTAYGPYRRLSGHAVDAQRLMEGPGPIARVVSLFREDSSLIECVGWLREIYLRRLEGKVGAAELERAVLALLDDGLLPDDVRVDQMDSDGLWVFQHDVRLPLRELSDGYRTVAALVMDIVRHLHRAFGELQIEQAEDTEGLFWRVLHSGVVLVDEIDLHLHVSWQKRIGFWLKRHFPNIQFIVTTHSPFICQAADPGGLIRLPAPGEDRQVEKVPEALYNTVVHGSIDDAVLTELFGLESLYSPATQHLREAVAKLEAKAQSGKATAEELKELEELRSQLPRTMSSAVEQALRTLVES